MRLAERTTVLNRVDDLLSSGSTVSLPGRDWAMEVVAERALDAARTNELTRARELAEQVLSSPTVSAIATARATEAAGRVSAWTGTDSATRRADRLLTLAADLYQALDALEWVGFVTFWRANSVHCQTGDLDLARKLMVEALQLLEPDSPRRSTVLSYYADLLTTLGEWGEVEQALAEAVELADRYDDVKSRAYAAWSRARAASARLDAMGTERWLHECERDAGDWFATDSGVTFLADAAELLDRVGLADEALRYLTRAEQRAPQDAFVKQAQATMLARGGDPEQALDALQGLMRGDWLEKRGQWRITLFAAWATFRAGRDGAGELAVQALTQAEAAGGAVVALSTEPELTRALLPLAVEAGSSVARSLLLGDRTVSVHLFGPPRVVGRDGAELPVPAGQPAELVRLLATHPDGMQVEQLIDTFYPQIPMTAGRHRVRQVLVRLRGAAGELVIREGDWLHLSAAWVDVREFILAADRVRAARGPRAVQLAYAALTLWNGSPLPRDPHADWASDIRNQLEHRHLGLLDVVAADAERRGSHQEAVTALTATLEHAPYEPDRYVAIAAHLLALGRHATAHHLARVTGVDLTRLKK